MTITGGSALPKDDIDRMVKEAEAHAAEDKKRREEAETRNQAENLAYSTEKVLKDNADKIPADVASEVSESVENLKSALKGDNFSAVKSGMDDLNEKAQRIGQAIYAAEQAQEAGAAGGEYAAPEGGAAPSDDDDVVDAEIVDEDETK